MSEDWANRQRRTNELVRLIAGHTLKNPRVKAEQLYGICKLTWITSSYDGDNSAYVKSTKIPALENALLRDYTGRAIEEVADDVALIVGSNDARDLVLSHTGFTNLYRAYRNSCREWLEENRAEVASLFRRALKLSTDADGCEIAKAIETLPPVPMANSSSRPMKPEYLLTPALFALDERLRFPLINGNEGVRALLSLLRAANSPLHEQYSRMVEQYGQGGIKDAADLDQIGPYLTDFVAVGGKRPTKKLLERKPVKGNVLPIKDESDIQALQKARSIVHRRVHNKLTNTVHEALASFGLLEGCDSNAVFDVLVTDYNGAGDDLLIEAKSSIEPAHIRMAVGQLFDYWFKSKGAEPPHLAILTPEKPGRPTIAMLEWMEIDILWIENGMLETCSENLKTMCAKQSYRRP